MTDTSPSMRSSRPQTINENFAGLSSIESPSHTDTPTP